MKKTLLSVAAGAVAASSYTATAEASPYKVQSGDSLWSIALKHNTTIAALKSYNQLTSSVIFPDQVLQTSPDSTPAKPAVKSTYVQPASAYTVKTGDFLSKIAHQHGISLQNLMKWNNLNTTLIYPGDVLNVTDPENASETPAPKTETTRPKAPAPAPAPKPAQNQTTYKVIPGDYLGKISSKFDVSVSDLKKWNDLESDLIFAGQLLKVIEKAAHAPEQPAATPPPPKPAPAPAPEPKQISSSRPEVYQVQSGDYLAKVAFRFDIPIENLRKWNKLPSDMIRIGQFLKLSVSGGQSNGSYNAAVMIEEAKKHLGLPYVWGGSTPAGFDCSGFVYYLYNKAGKPVPRYSSDGFFNRSYYVNDPVPGDIVFFVNTYRPGISHLGIYLGKNQFIHSGAGKVQISSLDSAYWKQHFDSFKRLY